MFLTTIRQKRTTLSQCEISEELELHGLNGCSPKICHYAHNPCCLSSLRRDEIETYKLQAAGHPMSFFISKDKKFVYKTTSVQEAEFYLAKTNDKCLRGFEKYLPKFLGVCLISSDSKYALVPPQSYCNLKILTSSSCLSMKGALKLENLLYELDTPNYIDIKLGTVTYCCCASNQKRIKMIQQTKSTTSHSLGFKICGYRKWNFSTESYVEFTKEDGKRLTQKNVLPTLIDVFTISGQDKPYKPALTNILNEILSLRRSIISSDALLRSTSLLIAYSASPSSYPQQDTRRCSVVKLIDFARSHPSGRSLHGDGGVIFGLDNLICYIRALLKIS